MASSISTFYDNTESDAGLHRSCPASLDKLLVTIRKLGNN